MKRKAFTLIELLVVIAMMAILAAMLFPTFSRARESARRASCASNLKQLGIGFAMYSQDFDEKMPGTGATVAFSAAPAPGVTNAQWIVSPPLPNGCQNGAGVPCRPDYGAIFNYVKSSQVYVCPSDTSGQTKMLSYAMNLNCGLKSLPAASSESTTILLVCEQQDLNPLCSLCLNDGNFSPAGDTPTNIHLGGTNYLYLDGHVKWQNETKYNSSSPEWAF